jgi:hypothetical protein
MRSRNFLRTLEDEDEGDALIRILCGGATRAGAMALPLRRCYATCHHSCLLLVSRRTPIFEQRCVVHTGSAEKHRQSQTTNALAMHNINAVVQSL